jgi:hypothetical protein
MSQMRAGNVMALIIVIAAGVVLGLLVFKNGKTVLGIIAIGVIIFMFQQANREHATNTAPIERSVK